MVRPQNEYISTAFADFLAERTQLGAAERTRFTELVTELMSVLLEGHSCLNVAAKQDLEILQNSGLTGHTGRREEILPLILHNGRLYLQRYFGYESRLAESVKTLAQQKSGVAPDEALLDNYFGKTTAGKDWQREAARRAVQNGLTIISGGPGTGKTTTVVKILAVLLDLFGADLHIELAAPTGKAAMRLQESVQASLAGLDVSDAVRNAMPQQAKTLHRLLGVQRNSPQFRHNRNNPLPCDMLIVDEASMVDLALMSKLVESLKPGGRLILLGDKDQLVSVESGAVLGDLMQGLPDNRVELLRTFRFDDNIKRLAEAVNGGRSNEAWELMGDDAVDNLMLLQGNPVSYATGFYLAYMAAVRKFTGAETDVPKLFALFQRFRVLCATRHGALGVDGINLGLELNLARSGFSCRSGEWYPGRPVLITRNDYTLDLYNGDIGLCLADADGKLKVWFEKGAGTFTAYSPFRLPQCETVFAMTVHKSQGSEFGEVLVVLPAEEESPVLSRELLYTGITRARNRVVIAAQKKVFQAAVSSLTERSTGLVDMLIAVSAIP